MRERMGKVLRKAGDAIGNVDDKVQGFIREKVYGLPEDGTALKSEGLGTMLRSLMGYTMHGSRPANPSKTQYRVKDDNAGRAWVAGSRAVQAGALTGAGVGLVNITSALTQFGGPADQQTGSQIQIDYNTPAHGSTLSPESHYVYKQVHKELMKGTEGVAEQLRADVSQGKYDYDPQLAAHFVDVMG